MTEFLVAITIIMALGSVLLKGYLGGNVERYKKELADMVVEQQKTAQLLRQTEAVLATVNDKERDMLRNKKKAVAELAAFQSSGDDDADSEADDSGEENG
jgi:hypothetical protein